MSTATILEISTDAETLSCGECGIVFSVPGGWVTARRRDHTTWYCPNGHPRAFLGETKEERRIRELEAAKDRLARQVEDTTEHPEYAPSAESDPR